VLVPRFGLKLLKANYIHSLNFTATWSFVFLLVKNTRKGFTLYCLFFNSTWYLPDFYWIIPFASGTNLCRLQAWFVWRKNEPHIGRPHWWHERIFRSQHSRKSFLSWSDGKVCATLLTYKKFYTFFCLFWWEEYESLTQLLWHFRPSSNCKNIPKCLETKCPEIIDPKLEDTFYVFRSTTDQIFTLLRIFEKSWEYAKVAFACFVGLEKALDSKKGVHCLHFLS